MAVYRVERTRDYTVMSNFHLKDTDLSLKAKGLLSMFLSFPDDWNYSTAKAVPVLWPEDTPLGRGLSDGPPQPGR